MWDVLLPTIIGGVIGWIGSIITLVYQGKKDKKIQQNGYKKYLFEKREPVFLDLAGVLSNISIPISVSVETGESNVDVDVLDEYLKQISNAIESNKNAIALYLPVNLQHELLKLKSEIYTITTDDKIQMVDLSSQEAFSDTEISKAITHAKEIWLQLRKEVTNLSPQ